MLYNINNTETFKTHVIATLSTSVVASFTSATASATSGKLFKTTHLGQTGKSKKLIDNDKHIISIGNSSGDVLKHHTIILSQSGDDRKLIHQLYRQNHCNTWDGKGSDGIDRDNRCSKTPSILISGKREISESSSSSTKGISITTSAVGVLLKKSAVKFSQNHSNIWDGKESGDFHVNAIDNDVMHILVALAMILLLKLTLSQSLGRESYTFTC